MAPMECTPVICPAIPHHMVASECRTNWRSRSIKHWTSVLQSQSSAGHRGRISTFVTVLSNLNHNAVPGRGLGSRSVHNTNRALRFTSRARFIRETVGEADSFPRFERDADSVSYRRKTYGRCSADFLTFVLAVFGPRERSTRSA